VEAKKLVEYEEFKEHKLMKLFHEHVGKMIEHLTLYVVQDLSKHDVATLEAEIQAALLRFQGHVDAEGDDFIKVLRQVKKEKNRELINVVKEILEDIDKEYKDLNELRKGIDKLVNKPSEHKVRNLMDTSRQVTQLQERILVLTNHLRKCLGQHPVSTEVRLAA
jgi:hypothetical protein